MKMKSNSAHPSSATLAVAVACLYGVLGVCSITFGSASPVLAQTAKAKVTILDLRPLLGLEFPDYEKALGEPSEIKHSVEPMMVEGGNDGEAKKIGETTSEVRFYKVAGLEKIVVAKNDEKIDAPGYHRTLTSNGQESPSVYYRVRITFRKADAPKTWQEALTRCGFNPEGVRLNYFRGPLYGQCPRAVEGKVVWEAPTKSLIFQFYSL